MQFENTERGDLSNTRVSSPLVPLPLLGPQLWWRQFIQTHRDQVQNKATAHRHVVVILCLDHSFVFRGFDKLDGSVSHTWYVPPESSVHRNKSSEAERDNGAYHVTTQHDLELATNFGGELSEMEPLNNHRTFWNHITGGHSIHIQSLSSSPVAAGWLTVNLPAESVSYWGYTSSGWWTGRRTVRQNEWRDDIPPCCGLMNSV